MTQSRTSLPRIKSPARLTFGQAMALGALHGPAELLPISSSGHTTAIPWLFGSAYAELDPELRKALEVALHAGAIIGLLAALPGELPHRPGELDPRHLRFVAAASAPAGVAGLALERRIESSLGTPSTIAAGLLSGAVAMALADRAPEERRADAAAAGDAVWLGLAQACALVPGVSRSGATLAAARWRRFRRQDASRLSGELAWPVITGATVLKAWRLREGDVRDHAPALLAGAATSSLSTLLTARFGRRSAGGSLLPFVLYRVGLAAAILLRLGLGRRAHKPGHAGSA